MTTKAKREHAPIARGIYKKRDIEDQLISLGVDKKFIPQLLKFTPAYIAFSREEVKQVTSKARKSIESFRGSVRGFLNALNIMPTGVQEFIFGEGPLWSLNPLCEDFAPPRYANLQRELEQLVKDCDSRLKVLSKSDRYSHTKWWPRWFIEQIKSMLERQEADFKNGYWNFLERKWTSDDSGSYNRLARVIAVLNKTLPEDVRVSKPDAVVRKMFRIDENYEKRRSK